MATHVDATRKRLADRGGRKGFDVGLELGVACRVTLGHVKTGEVKINANDNYALAA